MKKLIASSLFILHSFFCHAQEVFLLRDPADSSVMLNDGWIYHMGDEPNASRID